MQKQQRQQDNNNNNDYVSRDFFNMKINMLERELSKTYDFLIRIIEDNEYDVSKMKQQIRELKKSCKLKKSKKSKKCKKSKEVCDSVCKNTVHSEHDVEIVKVIPGTISKNITVKKEPDEITLEINEVEPKTRKSEIIYEDIEPVHPNHVVQPEQQEQTPHYYELTTEAESTQVEETAEEVEVEKHEEDVEVQLEEEPVEEEEQVEETKEEVEVEETEEEEEEVEVEETEEEEVEVEETEEEEVEVEETEEEEVEVEETEEEEVEVEETEEEEVEETEGEEVEVEETEEEEEELEEFVYKGKTYYVTDDSNGVMYQCLKDESVGDKVGVIKDGNVKLIKK